MEENGDGEYPNEGQWPSSDSTEVVIGGEIHMADPSEVSTEFYTEGEEGVSYEFTANDDNKGAVEYHGEEAFVDQEGEAGVEETQVQKTSEAEKDYEDTEEIPIYDSLQHAKSEFNKNRQITVHNMPREITEDTTRSFFHDVEIVDIFINEKQKQVVLSLGDSEVAEEVADKYDGTTLSEQEIQVSLHPIENLLCVTHLPFSLSEREFRRHMETYGSIEKCFLLRHETTGKSMGYGYVEFGYAKEKVSEACDKINGLSMGSCIIESHFAPSTILRFADLLSKVVLVDHLPVNYMDEEEFEKVVSKIAEPVWCKLGIKSGQPLAFGLVEYITPEDAALAQQEINGHNLVGHCIRASFCTPGISTQQTYNEIAQIRLSRMLPRRSPPPPLMPADGKLQPPPLISVESLTSPMIKKLLEDSPKAMENFGSVLNQLQLHMVSQQQQRLDPRPGLLGQAPSLPAGPIMNPNLQLSLLAVLIAHQVQMLSPNLINNPDTQQFILSQLSQPLGDRPSLLGTPLIAQANGLLQNLMNSNVPKKLSAATLAAKKSLEGGDEAEEEVTEATDCEAAADDNEDTDANQKFGSSFNLFGQSNVKITHESLFSFSSLMASLKTECSDLPGPEPDGEEPKAGSPFFNLPGVGLANTFLASFVETQMRNHTNAIQLGLVTSVLSQTLQKAVAEKVADKPKEKPVSLLDLPLVPPPGATGMFGQRAGLMGAGPGGSLGGAGLLGAPPPGGPGSLLGEPPNPLQALQKAASTYANMSKARQGSRGVGSGPEKRGYDSSNADYSNYYNQSAYGYSGGDDSYGYNYNQNYSSYYSPSNAVYGTGAWDNYHQPDSAWGTGQRPAKQPKVQSLMDYNTNQGTSGANKTSEQEWNTDDPNYMYHYHMWNYYNNMYQSGSASGYDYYGSQQNYGDNQDTSNNYDQYYTGVMNNQKTSAEGSEATPTPVAGADTDTKDYFTAFNPKAPPSLFSPTISKPPNIRKQAPGGAGGGHQNPYALTPNMPRRPHFMPSPEPSPEGLYVGQHSQGLGGHYTESHVKKKLNDF